jgi:hypothetical protein
MQHTQTFQTPQNVPVKPAKSGIRSIQAPPAVVMVRPHRFTSNPETALDNSFQSTVTADSAASIAQAAYDEVTNAAAILRSHGVRVHLYEDEGSSTPDSVFPNNWFSTHSGGHIALFPMYSPNRRRERRSDVIDMLKTNYRVQDVIDYTGLEQDGLFLEGTGAMVLDHLARVAYTAKSNRANAVALERFCTHFNYEPMVFGTADAAGRAVYHDLFSDPARAAEIRARLEESGRTVIALTNQQIAEFAGNALELTGHHGRILAMSARAAASLTADQKAQIEPSARIVALPVPTIEMAGGSVRCMLAGVHLAAR